MAGLHVALHGVDKSYRIGSDSLVHALNDVNLDIDAGSVVAFQGPSGSGKSTLLHVIGAMDRPDRGSIRVDDLEITTLNAKAQTVYRRRIGFVFQRFHLLPALTLLDNVIAPVLPYETNFDKHERALELLRAVGLEDRAGAPPARLSGGQQQRVAIARALINTPGLLLADEPTGNLDTDTGAAIIDLLLDVHDRHGTTILVATHDPAVANRCDRLVTVRDGSITDHPGTDHVGLQESERDADPGRGEQQRRRARRPAASGQTSRRWPS